LFGISSQPCPEGNSTSFRFAVAGFARFPAFC